MEQFQSSSIRKQLRVKLKSDRRVSFPDPFLKPVGAVGSRLYLPLRFQSFPKISKIQRGVVVEHQQLQHVTYLLFRFTVPSLSAKQPADFGSPPRSGAP